MRWCDAQSNPNLILWREQRPYLLDNKIRNAVLRSPSGAEPCYKIDGMFFARFVLFTRTHQPANGHQWPILIYMVNSFSDYCQWSLVHSERLYSCNCFVANYSRNQATPTVFYRIKDSDPLENVTLIWNLANGESFKLPRT